MGEVLRLLPNHFVGLPIPFALSGVLFLLSQAYKVLQSSYFFIFGDLLSTPHFPFLCCRPESNTDCPNPACTTVWTKDILSKRKGIYILKGYFSFPPRRQGNA